MNSPGSKHYDTGVNEIGGADGRQPILSVSIRWLLAAASRRSPCRWLKVRLDIGLVSSNLFA